MVEKLLFSLYNLLQSSVPVTQKVGAWILWCHDQNLIKPGIDSMTFFGSIRFCSHMSKCHGPWTNPNPDPKNLKLFTLYKATGLDDISTPLGPWWLKLAGLLLLNYSRFYIMKKRMHIYIHTLFLCSWIFKLHFLLATDLSAVFQPMHQILRLN